MPWLWYRVCGPLYALASRLTTTAPAPRCPWCGADVSAVWCERPYFALIVAWSETVPGEPTVHYAEGEQTCPRCRYRWIITEGG